MTQALDIPAWRVIAEHLRECVALERGIVQCREFGMTEANARYLAALNLRDDERRREVSALGFVEEWMVGGREVVGRG